MGMTIKDKPHGFDDSKGRMAKLSKAFAALGKRYPKMSGSEQREYMLGLGAGRVLALLAYESKAKAEAKKPAKKPAKKVK